MLTNFERRKFIIDTDTASDDCAAIMMAVLSEKAEILGLTTVAGNIPLDKATNNALQTLEVCGADIPVFEGASHPLIRPLKTAVSVHGEDGLGDRGLVNPKGKAQTKPAVDFILDSVKKYPGDIEIIAIGPVTNIANAILTDPETKKKVKKIWSMGTAGFGFGNATPVAEFNVYVDAEAYKIMLDFGLPLPSILSSRRACSGHWCCRHCIPCCGDILSLRVQMNICPARNSPVRMPRSLLRGRVSAPPRSAACPPCCR